MTADTRGGLALCLTPGTTIRDWARAGYLSREVRYYRELSRGVGPVTFVSPGDPPSEPLGGIAVLPNAARLPSALYWTTAPLRVRRRATILKTNQLAGVLAPMVARAIGLHVVARGGWVPSEPWRHRRALGRQRVRSLLRESVLCRIADLVILTTRASADYVRRRYGLPPDRVTVVPNYVDIDLFAPRSAIQKVPRLVTMVGRLAEEKNLFAAVEAAAAAGARLRLIGGGKLGSALEAHARRHGGALELLGTQQHEQVPRSLAESEVFLLVSLYEGHPKSLIEAMACGLACVVTPSPGIVEVVQPGRTALVTEGTSAEQIAAALKMALGDAAMRATLGRNARQDAVKRYALERVVGSELDAYRRMGWIAG